MAESREFVPGDREMGRYLLGLLPDEEAERFDEASIVDDHVASRLRSAENDLVDAYVSGTLDEETRERFETFYLSSRRRRDKVKSAQRFLDAVNRAQVSGAAMLAPARSGRAALRSRIPWSIAAAVLFLLACGVLLLENVRLRQGLSQARRDGIASDRRSQTLAQQLEAGRAEHAEALKALEEAHAALEARERSADRRSPSTSGSPTLATLALVLSPQTRAVGPLPTVAVSPALEQVAFDLRLESNDASRYRVELKDPGTGRTLWRSGSVPARAVRGVSLVSIAIPVAMLPRQHGVLELAGLSAAGRAEPVASYTFQVIRP
jgi:hypothetical protein